MKLETFLATLILFIPFAFGAMTKASGSKRSNPDTDSAVVNRGLLTLRNMKRDMLKTDVELTPLEMELIFNENKEILADLSLNNYANEHVLLIEVCNIVRYSENVDNEAIVKTHFSEESIFFSRDYMRDLSTETVAMAALLAGNLNLFLKMHQIRYEKIFSDYFYQSVSTSQALMALLPDDILLNVRGDFFEITYESFRIGGDKKSWKLLDPTLCLEVIARKDAESRTLQDLDAIFLDNNLGKLIGLAFYYHLDTLIDRLANQPNLIRLIVKICLSYSSKVRNVLNNTVRIMYEILLLIPNLYISDTDASDASDVINMLFYNNANFLKMLVDPENAHIIDQYSGFRYWLISDKIFTLLKEDSTFKNNLASSHAAGLRQKIRFNLGDLLKPNLLAREIVDLLLVLGLEVGNFGLEDTASMTRKTAGTVEEFKQIRIDKALAYLALSSFENQKSKFGGDFNNNPMHLKSFGVFQLWRESNIETFNNFAPKEISEAFNKMI